MSVVSQTIPQLIAEGTAYYLFNDYKKWLEIAQQTPSKEDDEFDLFGDDNEEDKKA